MDSPKHPPLTPPLPKQPPLRPPKPQARHLFEDVFFIDGEQYKSYTSARGILFTPTGEALNFCPDTGTGIALIKESKLAHFPNVKLRTGPRTVNLTGIGKGPAVQSYVRLPVQLLTTDGEALNFIVEAYVVKSLACGILLGNSFLAPNRLDFIQAKSGTDFARLEFQGRKIRISV
jgi:hypothetical protein